jgi:uncharacterized membrane protein YfcA
VNVHHAALLFFAAVLGGMLNSVAGGGSFIAFPALLFTGMSAIPANATNTVALWPGTVASIFAYRRELANRAVWKLLGPLFAVTFFGSIAGALLLLKTPEKTFVRLIPWLLGSATALFAFGARLTAPLRNRLERHASVLAVIGATALQLVVSIYIGYFGAGAGILMLALLSIMGMENIHTMNAFKSTLGACANGIAVITFIVAGKVMWPQALLMIVGAGMGGYGGAWVAQKIDPKRVRWVVIATGCTMTVYFAWRYG